MNITYATYPTAYETPGGGEIQILQYKKHLTACGVNVSLFNPWAPELRSIDIFHYFSCYRGSENILDELSRRGIPIVLSPTLWVDKDTGEYQMPNIKKMMEMADRIICNSDMECDLLSNTFSVVRTKYSTVYNGVDPSFIQPTDPQIFRSLYDIQNEYILNVANVEPRKNQLRLIDAVKRLGLKLVIIGGIRDKEYFEKCMSVGEGCMTYIPAVPHDSDTLRSAYAGCSVFALPSLLETPGLAALEAASVGAKVLITSVGCAREYFQNHAIYADPLDVDSIAAGIEEARGFRNQNSARDLVRQKFMWPVVVGRLVDIYQNREVFCPSISSRGFHLAEFEPIAGFWSVWSKHKSEIICDRPGLLKFEWRAAQASKVDVLVDGVQVRIGIELNTDWVQFSLDLEPNDLDGKSCITVKVTHLNPSIYTEDPRELGIALRSVNLIDPHLYVNREVFGPNISSSGFHLAEFEPIAGFWSVWSKHKAKIICEQPGILTFEWRAAQASKVDVLVDGVAVRIGIELSTDWVQFSLDLEPNDLDGKSWITVKVSHLNPSIYTEDPRELGIALRSVNLIDPHLYVNREVFGPNISSSGFHLAEFEPIAGFWSVWSKHKAKIICKQPGILTFEWRAAQASKVDVLVDGVAVRIGIELNTDWVQFSLDLEPNDLDGKSCITVKVTHLNPSIYTEDPRELGIALRSVNLIDPHLFENREVFGPNISSSGFHLAEFEPIAGFWSVWSKRDAEIVCDGPGMLSFEWRTAQPSRVLVLSNGIEILDVLELGTQWVSVGLVLEQRGIDGKSRIKLTVIEIDTSIRIADPRDLGVALRHVFFAKTKQVLQ